MIVQMVFLIDCILCGKPIDIPTIILKSMIVEGKDFNSRHNLPYGVLITKLLVNMGIKFSPNSRFLKQGKSISICTLHLMGIGSGSLNMPSRPNSTFSNSPKLKKNLCMSSRKTTTKSHLHTILNSQKMVCKGMKKIAYTLNIYKRRE